jgi:hypothetical protein
VVRHLTCSKVSLVCTAFPAAAAAAFPAAATPAELPWCGLVLVRLQLPAHQQVRGGGCGQGPQGQRSVMRAAAVQRRHDMGLQVRQD